MKSKEGNWFGFFSISRNIDLCPKLTLKSIFLFNLHRCPAAPLPLGNFVWMALSQLASVRHLLAKPWLFYFIFLKQSEGWNGAGICGTKGLSELRAVEVETKNHGWALVISSRCFSTYVFPRKVSGNNLQWGREKDSAVLVWLLPLGSLQLFGL